MIKKRSPVLTTTDRATKCRIGSTLFLDEIDDMTRGERLYSEVPTPLANLAEKSESH